MTDVSARIFVETCCCSLDPVNDDIPSAVGDSTRKSPVPQVSLKPSYRGVSLEFAFLCCVCTYLKLDIIILWSPSKPIWIFPPLMPTCMAITFAAAHVGCLHHWCYSLEKLTWHLKMDGWKTSFPNFWKHVLIRFYQLMVIDGLGF